MSEQDDGDLEAEVDAELDQLQAAEPVPLEQQMREGNEARREAFKEWERQFEAENEADQA